MNYGSLHLRIEEILRQKGISKNQICKDLDIPRTNFNKYCRSAITRLDSGMLCKLCYYLEVDLGDLVVYTRPFQDDPAE